MSESQPIIQFSAERTVIPPGEHTTLHWRVEGVKAVYLCREGEPWQEHGVVGQGERQVSPPETTTYCLRVVMADDSVEIYIVEIQVRAPRPSQTFSADRTEINLGECVTFRWHVEGVKAVYFFAEGERWQDHGTVGIGEQQVCPPQTTTYCLRVIKTDNSVEIEYITVQVKG